MSADAIAAIGALAPVDARFIGASAAAAPVDGFAAMVTRGLDQVEAALTSADNDMRQLAAGDSPNLHVVMMHLEEAKLSLQLLAQVRNRLLDAYQEVMRMQV